jgi:hypothetical protein
MFGDEGTLAVVGEQLLVHLRPHASGLEPVRQPGRAAAVMQLFLRGGEHRVFGR